MRPARIPDGCGIKCELDMLEDVMTGNMASYGSVIRVLALLLGVSLVITGCSRTSRESVVEGNKRLVREMNYEVWNKGNLDRMEEFLSPNFARHFLPDGSELRGIDSLRERVREHRQAFPDWKEEIKHIVAEGDLVVIHFVSTGTNQGSWQGNPPAEKKIEIHEMSILRIEDGRVAEQWLMPDIFSLQRQLASD